MDVFFFRIFLMEETLFSSLLVAMIYLGAVLGLVVTRFLLPIQHAIRRVHYLVAVSFSTVLLSSIQIGWVYLPVAAELGLFSLLNLALWGSFLLFGIVSWRLAHARSLDVIGSGKNAWFGFVPFLNFWLFFAAGDGTQPATQRSQSKLQKAVFDPSLILLGILGLLYSRASDSSIESMEPPVFESYAAIDEIAARALTIEEGFSLEVERSKTDLPLEIEPGLTMVTIGSSKKLLRIGFKFFGSQDDFGFDILPGLSGYYCQSDVFGRSIDRGGVLMLVVDSEEENTTKSYRLGGTDCSV